MVGNERSADENNPSLVGYILMIHIYICIYVQLLFKNTSNDYGPNVEY